MKFLGDIWYLICTALGLKIAVVQTAYTEDIPEAVEENILYVIGENKSYWCLKMKCPCGCGEEIQLGLLKGNPKWDFVVHWNGSVSVTPSIWRSKGCLSHFFIRRGKIVWVRNQEIDF